MATATEISTRALKRLGVIDSRSTPDAADIADATEELTSMINSWEASGLSGDFLPLDARFEQFVVDMLVVRVAPMFGKSPTEQQNFDAREGWNKIQAAFFAVPSIRFDPMLTGMTNTYFNEFDTFNWSLDYWQPNTDYPLRAMVINDANIYECHGAGTSAPSGGPTGTDAEIVDGSVTWVWRRVAG